jgi:glycerate-2-kinase
LRGHRNTFLFVLSSDTTRLHFKEHPTSPPNPDDLAVRATEKMIELLQGAGPNDLVIARRSGSSSALLLAHPLGIALADNDSNTFFQKLRDLIITGPTNTNVDDRYVIVAT